VLRLLASAAAASCVLTGCVSGGAEREPLPSELTGVIARVEGPGDDVTAFTLEAGLERYEIRIDPLRDYGFPLLHPREHERDGQPVRCKLDERAGELYAVAIEDA
jgi:hypothetical protein